jgi:hypothetical protein
MNINEFISRLHDCTMNSLTVSAENVEADITIFGSGKFPELQMKGKAERLSIIFSKVTSFSDDGYEKGRIYEIVQSKVEGKRVTWGLDAFWENRDFWVNVSFDFEKAEIKRTHLPLELRQEDLLNVFSESFNISEYQFEKNDLCIIANLLQSSIDGVDRGESEKPVAYTLKFEDAKPKSLLDRFDLTSLKKNGKEMKTASVEGDTISIILSGKKRPIKLSYEKCLIEPDEKDI